MSRSICDLFKFILTHCVRDQLKICLFPCEHPVDTLVFLDGISSPYGSLWHLCHYFFALYSDLLISVSLLKPGPHCLHYITWVVDFMLLYIPPIFFSN